MPKPVSLKVGDHKAWKPVRAPLAKVTALAAMAVMGVRVGHAESLMDLYQAAKSYDAAYLSAKAQADSTQYQYEQSRALLRPNLGLKATINRSHFESNTTISQSAALQAQALGLGDGSTSANANTTNKNLSIAAKQSLFNKPDSVKVDQAEKALVASQADLAIAENDLAVRLTQAYFDVLAAQDVLETTQANKKALAEQLASAKRNFEVGNATITDTREAQARYDLASAQEIAATNDLHVKRIALDQLVGRADVKPDPLATPLKLDALVPGPIDDWVAQSANAPIVRKAMVGLDVAKLEVEKAKAGHLPTVDAVAALQRNLTRSSNIEYALQSPPGNTASVGLELNMPLYAGGAIQNRVREVLALQDKAEQDVENARRTVALGTRQTYALVRSGMAQVKAYEAAEASAKLALEATQLGYRVGVRINKDVLDAQTALANTQKDLAKARYDVIVGTVKLKQVAGTLTPDDLAELNRLLAPTH